MDNLQTKVWENLAEGLSIKNYKEMCKILDEPEKKGGDSKIAQIKEWQRYFEFDRAGQKFIITNIYKEPFPKVDDRNKGNNAIYVKYIETILLRYLSQQKGFQCTLKKKQIWMILGMINNKYQNVSQKKLLDIDDRITRYELNNFYQRCNQKLEKILFTSLNNLKNRCLISWWKETVIVDINKNSFLASPEDVKNIDAVKYEVLREMGLEKIIQVYCYFRQDEFYSKINDKLLELYNWEFTYQQYSIVYTHEHIIEAMDKNEIELNRLALNEQVINSINDQAEDKANKQQKKFNVAKCIEIEKIDPEWRECFDIDEKDLNIEVFNYPKCYVEIQKILSRELLQICDKKDDIVILTKDEELLFL